MPSNIIIRGNKFKFMAEDFTSIDEPEVLDYIDSLPAGDTFYDLGSCVGYFSLYAKNKGLDVYSFEVDPKNFGGLIWNVQANSLNKPYLGFDIKIFNVGVSSGDKRMWKLLVGQDIVGGHRKFIITNNFTMDISELAKIDTTKGNSNFKMVDVQINSLDNIILERDLPYPDHLKVDIDGSEYDFLLGAKNSLEHAKTMMIELREASLYSEMIEMITNYGFVLKGRTMIHPHMKTDLFNCWFEKK